MFTILVLAHKCASCLVVPMDITNYESHAKCLQQVVDQHGKVGTKAQSELIENSQILIIVERWLFKSMFVWFASCSKQAI